MFFGWLRNSLRRVYGSWQILESRRLAAQQELARQYLALRRVAESLRLETDQGLLRAARLILDQPLDPQMLKAHHRLKKAFAILGKSFFRRAPAALHMEYRQYACHIDALCQKFDEMGSRLVSSQKILEIFHQTPERSRTNYFRMALISPEAARLVIQLGDRRRAEHQARENCLARGRVTRIATCQRWVTLLPNFMPSGTFRKFERSLKELAEKVAGERQDIPKLLADHAKLDLLIAVANRLALRTAADLLSQKTN